MYIHQHTCISAQQTFGDINLDSLKEAADNKLLALEPKYEGIPSGILRRMGKAVRLGVGTALPIIKKHSNIDGIIIGTANGGMEDCIKFLNQIIDYEEGLLTPGNFVQSTPNAIAAQAGLMAANKSYNITHVHRGLAFENSLADAMMLLKENPSANYLVGGVDEISSYNYNIDYLDGWFKTEPISNAALYETNTKGSLAGEGAAMFLVSNESSNAIAIIEDVKTIHTEDENLLKDVALKFLQKNRVNAVDIDMLISGENGDNRLKPYYNTIENILDDKTSVVRCKHMTGEMPTFSALSLWLACNTDRLPEHMFKYGCSTKAASQKILIYNNHKRIQHSFILAHKF